MHLGIIMDGNRRWATSHGFAKFYGHKVGFDNARNMIQIVNKKGIQHLTLWALSKENLEKRNTDEISGIIQLIDTFVDFVPEFQKNNIRFATIGDIEKLPEKTQKILQRTKDETKDATGMFFTVALVYSGQNEIIRGIQKMFQSQIDPTTLNESIFRQFLDTFDMPPIDLIIRTGGDKRHSGFLLYDSAYSEYYFSEKYWPEFHKEDLEKALDSFYNAKRNFGK